MGSNPILSAKESRYPTGYRDSFFLTERMRILTRRCKALGSHLSRKTSASSLASSSAKNLRHRRIPHSPTGYRDSFFLAERMRILTRRCKALGSHLSRKTSASSLASSSAKNLRHRRIPHSPTGYRDSFFLAERMRILFYGFFI